MLQALHDEDLTGIPVAPSWNEFPQAERDAVVSGVRLAMQGATAGQLHEAWCDGKLAEGWTWGQFKDTGRKTHPCLLPYSQLPAGQRVKDDLFCGIVAALS